MSVETNKEEKELKINHDIIDKKPNDHKPDASAAITFNDTYLSTKKTRIRVDDLQIAKTKGEKWPMLTSYDSVTASIFDKARIPCLLIGDSASQVVFGRDSTIETTVDELILLSKIVSISTKRALVISDLPFGSYRESPKQALRTATRFMKEAKVHGVKLEGGSEIVEHVKLLTSSGIPVMSHVGLTPQSEHTLGGYKIQGRTSEAADKLVEDAKLLEAAGSFACVVELVPNNVGQLLAKSLTIPVIGIGAGSYCDAQVLVWADMAGFCGPTESSKSYIQDNTIDPSSNKDKFCQRRMPKFVKQYANLGETLYKATQAYANDVCSGSFPAIENCYKS